MTPRYFDGLMRNTAIVVCMLFVASGAAYGQNTSQAADMLADLGGKFRSFLTLIMGLGALVSLTFSIYHLIKGQKEAATKTIWVMVALAIGSTMLAVLGNFLTADKVTSANDLETLKEEVKSVLQIMLVLVGMITMTSITIKMSRGEEEAFRKFMTWIVVLVVGSALLEAI